jgi:hypothetical protein
LHAASRMHLLHTWAHTPCHTTRHVRLIRGSSLRAHCRPIATAGHGLGAAGAAHPTAARLAARSRASGVAGAGAARAAAAAGAAAAGLRMVLGAAGKSARSGG